MTDGVPAIGPGGCGTWSSYTVPEIWSMLAYEDATLSVDQATAWNRTYDLLASHAQNLQTLRDNLAERWPPERNEASAVFLEYLDNLIDSVHPASFASSSNAVVLSDLLDTLEGAKEKLAPLHDQWQAAAASGTPDPKLQADLNTQAATIMSSTDVAVYQHGQRFVVPPEYEPPVGDYGTTTPFMPTPAINGPPTRRVQPAAPSTFPGVVESRARTSREVSPSLSGHASIDHFSQKPQHTTPVEVSPERPHPTPPSVAPLPEMRSPRLTQPSRRGDVIGEPASPRAGSPPGRLSSPYRGIAPEYGVGSNYSENGSRASLTDKSSGLRGSEVPENRTPNGVGGLLGGYGGRAPLGRRLESGESYVDWHVPEGVPPILKGASEVAVHDPGPGVIGIDR